MRGLCDIGDNARSYNLVLSVISVSASIVTGPLPHGAGVMAVEFARDGPRPKPACLVPPLSVLTGLSSLQNTDQNHA